jgi:murein DD-endopeptidase MepM/ murein hydrolase activator NlpD
MRFREFCNEMTLDQVMGSLIGKSPMSLGSLGLTLDPEIKTDTPFDPKTNTPPRTDAPTTSNNIVQTDVKSGLPVKGPITSGFGRRKSGMHYGTDFGVPVGTPIVAPDDGVVWMAGWGGDAGIMVAINSGNVQHKLMHLSATKVKPGDKVKRGQVVGLSGNTGYSTGPHLHWSKYVAGKPVDPMQNVG